MYAPRAPHLDADVASPTTKAAATGKNIQRSALRGLSYAEQVGRLTPVPEPIQMKKADDAPASPGPAAEAAHEPATPGSSEREPEGDGPPVALIGSFRGATARLHAIAAHITRAGRAGHDDGYLTELPEVLGELNVDLTQYLATRQGVAPGATVDARVAAQLSAVAAAVRQVSHALWMVTHPAASGDLSLVRSACNKTLETAAAHPDSNPVLCPPLADLTQALMFVLDMPAAGLSAPTRPTP